jgi:hypothetical protein
MRESEHSPERLRRCYNAQDLIHYVHMDGYLLDNQLILACKLFRHLPLRLLPAFCRIRVRAIFSASLSLVL